MLVPVALTKGHDCREGEKQGLKNGLYVRCEQRASRVTDYGPDPCAHISAPMFVCAWVLWIFCLVLAFSVASNFHFLSSSLLLFFDFSHCSIFASCVSMPGSPPCKLFLQVMLLAFVVAHAWLLAEQIILLVADTCQTFAHWECIWSGD